MGRRVENQRRLRKFTPSWRLGSGGTENRLKELLDIVVPGGGVPEGAQLPLSYGFRERERIAALEIDVVKDERREPRDVFVLQRISLASELFYGCIYVDVFQRMMVLTTSPRTPS